MHGLRTWILAFASEIELRACGFLFSVLCAVLLAPYSHSFFVIF